jgi:hypothetical protein
MSSQPTPSANGTSGQPSNVERSLASESGEVSDAVLGAAQEAAFQDEAERFDAMAEAARKLGIVTPASGSPPALADDGSQAGE